MKTREEWMGAGHKEMHFTQWETHSPDLLTSWVQRMTLPHSGKSSSAHPFAASVLTEGMTWDSGVESCKCFPDKGSLSPAQGVKVINYMALLSVKLRKQGKTAWCHGLCYYLYSGDRGRRILYILHQTGLYSKFLAGQRELHRMPLLQK